ncbi:hypothetical protein JQ609_08585 [Bradyrhizobium sp. AUGA SZCCT0169]|nr:hypothetical protein [Bradyrhizobium sp. AUGA SZCCT0169]
MINRSGRAGSLRTWQAFSVYSVSYEASVSRWDGTAMHLTERANNVLARVLAESELQTGQLVLIGHSLGGLVIKQLLRTAESTARHDANAAGLLRRIEKVAFLATPHTGAALARWGDRLRILARPSAATASLVENDPNLRDLNLWYRDWANEYHISHLTLTETDAVSFLGTIVEPDSGDPGLANSRPVSIIADHFTICKPTSRDHDTYVLVRKFIETAFERPKTPTEEKLEALPDAVVAKLLAALRERGETTSAQESARKPSFNSRNESTRTLMISIRLCSNWSEQSESRLKSQRKAAAAAMWGISSTLCWLVLPRNPQKDDLRRPPRRPTQPSTSGSARRPSVAVLPLRVG